MALTPEQRTDLAKLYMATFDRAPDAEGFDFWATELEEEGSILDVARSMFVSDEGEAIYSDLDSEGLVDKVYNNLLNREPDQDGKDYWVGELDDGNVAPGRFVEAVINGAEDNDTEQGRDDAELIQQKTEVAEYFVDLGLNDTEKAASIMGQIESGTSVSDVKAELDSFAGGGKGDDFKLTEDADDETGTSDAETFEAPLTTVDFQNGNTLNTGDVLDGGGGTDTLDAKLTNDLFVGGDTGAVRPTTESVEDIQVTALHGAADLEADEADNAQAGNVTLDAADMQDVEKVGSYGSNSDLTIRDLTTLTSDGEARNTDEVTVRMDHTANVNHSGDPSDLTAYFDENYLLSGEDPGEDRIQLKVMNQDAYDAGLEDDPLTSVVFEQLRFTVDGQEFDLTDVDGQNLLGEDGDTTGEEITSYQELVDALNTAFDKLRELNPDDDAIQSLEASLNGTFDDPNSREGTRIDITAEGDSLGFPTTNPNNSVFLEPSEESAEVDDQEIENSNRFDNANEGGGTGPEDRPVATNVELEKVGRGSEGGDLTIGGKSDSADGDGISVFNVDVLGGNDLPNNLASMTSTNDALREVNIESVGNDELTPEEELDEGENAYANLTIGNGQTAGTPFGGDLDLLDASSFQGDLSLGTDDARVEDLNTLDATGGGDVTFWADINGDDEGSYDYTTGSGSDTLIADLDGGAIDTVGESFTASTGGSDDVVAIDGGDLGEVSQATMEELSNQELATGSGDDTVTLNGVSNFDIDAGSGSDFVDIETDDINGPNSGDASAGDVTVGKATGSQPFSDQVLYKAALTVNFAGFTNTVEVDTGDDFVAQQTDINDAIQSAIDESPELSDLLSVEEGTADQQITVESNVAGANEMAIDLFQPDVVDDSDPADDEVNVEDTEGLGEALVQAEGADSDDVDTAEDVAEYFNDEVPEGSLNEDGDDEGTGQFNWDFVEPGHEGTNSQGAENVNLSNIDMGNGSNDVVVLDSNPDSANTLEITDSFGRVSVVNWFEEDGGQISGDPDPTSGNHGLDFTAFLTDQDTSSGSEQSETPIDVTTDDIAPGTDEDVEANEVLRVEGFENDNADDETWDELNASALEDALNGDEGYGNFDGSIDPAAEDEAADNELAGDTRNHIMMVENDTRAQPEGSRNNAGEYKVFHVTSNNADGEEGDFTVQGELGVIDFGTTLNFDAENLVGSADDDREELLEQVREAADDVEPEVDDDPDLVTETSGFNTLQGTNIVDGNQVTSGGDVIEVAANFHLDGSTLDGGSGSNTLQFGNSEAYDLTQLSDFAVIDTIDMENVADTDTLTMSVDQYDEVNQATNAAGAEVLIGGDVSDTTDFDAWESDDSYDLTLDDVNESDRAFTLNEVDSIATLKVDDNGMEDPTFNLAKDGSVDKVDVQDLDSNGNTLTFGASASNTIGELNFGSSVGDTNVDKLTIDGNGDDLTIGQVQQGDDTNVSLGDNFTIENTADDEAQIGTDAESQAFELEDKNLTITPNDGDVTVGEVAATADESGQIATDNDNAVTIQELTGDLVSGDLTISGDANDGTTIEDASSLTVDGQTVDLTGGEDLSIGEDSDTALEIDDGALEAGVANDSASENFTGDMTAHLLRNDNDNESSVTFGQGDDTVELHGDNSGDFTFAFSSDDSESAGEIGRVETAGTNTINSNDTAMEVGNDGDDQFELDDDIFGFGGSGTLASDNFTTVADTSTEIDIDGQDMIVAVGDTSDDTESDLSIMFVKDQTDGSIALDDVADSDKHQLIDTVGVSSGDQLSESDFALA
ncbi:MAG: DUF4214 domain-containing protein [Halorhodospira sp.]